MSHILEIIVEPSQIIEGSKFLLKIKVQKERKTFSDLKKIKCSKIKNIQCKEIKEA